ncbi:MAG: hypothetical protein JWO99_233 [Candidatus Saccharibacteria bacterium]|nr:hypothetical protein [Candidatus Saccharibacteria bacterium]
MYNDQTTSFTAPIRDAIGPFSGFSRNYPKDRSGIRLGPMLDVREGLYFDMPRMRSEGRCGGPLVGILGDKDKGKSTVGKILATEDGAVYNGMKQKRIYADNHRHTEYAELARYYNNKMIGLDEKINVFDLEVGFTIADHQITGETLFVIANDGTRPVNHQQFVIETAVFKMFADTEREKSAESFARILLGLTEQDGYNYLLASVDFKDKTQNIDWEQFKQDAGYVAQRVVRFLNGSFGKTIGGTGSIAKHLTGENLQGASLGQDKLSRATVINFYRKDEATTAFLINYLNRIRTSAEERGDRRFMYDTELHDENYGMWDYFEYSDDTVKRNKRSRTLENAPLFVFTTHSLLDYGSAKYSELAFTNARGIDVWFFFGMEKSADREATRDFFKLSPMETERLANLQVGQFGFKVGNEDVRFAEIVLTPMRRRLSYTNKANDDALVRR